MSKKFIEDQVVDLVVDVIGDMTMNEMCQVGVRERIAEKISEPLIVAMEEQYEKKAKAMGWPH